MTVSFNPVSKDDKHILQNLYSLYLHDLSEFTEGLDISTDGSFEFDSFELIWKEEGVTPYFLKKDKKIAGFVLLLERPFLNKDYDYSINDIFILKKYRRKGTAIALLKEMFKQKKGSYFVVQLASNIPAVKFWRRIFSELSIDFEEKKKIVDNEECLVQSFQI
ncbi:MULTISPECIES: GNAT family N-acetyltransferase [unclassified Bacillus (in: firmicutes)]|uniref:GNAT family N-acetyltransferase n=1 Tax=unclassified Bacillus (in: firmicutes) TaxID=185979 RepID=UPI001BEC9F9F|nr:MULTISPECIES: GNAT family N-acetyltransferase [unclassified Bacillus (in: firmicutes)]MBT2616295.1 GNAT family N-acetyltransferase [Bacillus sp. ISL-78]MBT2632297.1 GNAT family N-acetyltransferase [Bacillus sp. ISL-101]